MRAVLAISVLLLAAITAFLLWPDTAQADDYTTWAGPHRANIAAYKKFLQQRKVADVVPMPQLLKSARNWQECHAEPDRKEHADLPRRRHVADRGRA